MIEKMLRSLLSLLVTAIILLSIFAPETLKNINFDTISEYAKKHMGNFSKFLEGVKEGLNSGKEKS